MASSKKKGATEKLIVEGELTIYTAADTKEKIGKLLESETVEIDLSQVGEIDTAGLQLLLLARRECAQREKKIVFSNPSEAVRACWKMCNLQVEFGAAV
jgi:anti-anti-sigma factor